MQIVGNMRYCVAFSTAMEGAVGRPSAQEGSAAALNVMAQRAVVTHAALLLSKEIIRDVCGRQKSLLAAMLYS